MGGHWIGYARAAWRASSAAARLGERGAVQIEYVIIAGLIAVVGIAAAAVIGNAIDAEFDEIATELGSL